MNALLILIPLGLVLAGIAVAVFFWATRHGQFDDLDTPSILPLLDNEPGDDDDARQEHACARSHSRDAPPRFSQDRACVRSDDRDPPPDRSPTGQPG